MLDRNAADGVGPELLSSVEEPGWTVRAKAAERLAALYCAGTLGAGARRAAEEAFRILRYDPEAVVRRILAECLKAAPKLPRDIALSIATDRAEIAAPFLEHTPALEDCDLARIVAENPGEHRRAVARRRPLSAALVAVLSAFGDPELKRAALDTVTGARQLSGEAA